MTALSPRWLRTGTVSRGGGSAGGGLAGFAVLLVALTLGWPSNAVGAEARTGEAESATPVEKDLSPAPSAGLSLR